jgi:hypothetical protein
MSYDFLMMKPKSEIRSAYDLGEDTLLQQDPSTLVHALSTLFPELAWRKEADGGWFGSLQGDDSWYEFRIGVKPDYTWSVCTSHRTNTRKLIPTICNALGVIAFDGQANCLIRPDRQASA